MSHRVTTSLHEQLVPSRRGGARLPIVPRSYPVLTAADMSWIGDRAAAEQAREPFLDTVEPFGRVATGSQPGPSLILEDHSAVSLFRGRGNAALAYRSLLLAGDDDIMAVDVPRRPDFEAYCRDHLGLGKVEVLRPRADAGEGLAEQCLRDTTFVQHVARRARAAGALTILPYMGSGPVWRLAGAIAERAGIEVRVAAPPPRLTRRVNDKLWFTRVAGELFGAQSVPEASAVHGMAALAGRLAALARRHATVAVKLPSSAGSSGNLVFDSADLAGMGLAAVRDRVAELLADLGWGGDFPLMVTDWEGPLWASPSAQLWIPPPGAGPPVLEGLFDQIVAGSVARFSGCRPCALPAHLQDLMAAQAVRLGALFQALGYMGRCSFDAIVIGRDPWRACLHWVECNGRWGGVSIPMTLANRCEGDWTRRPFVTIERPVPARCATSIDALLDALGDALYHPCQDRGGAVVLSPAFLDHGRLSLMVLGDHAQHAMDTAEAVIERLWDRLGDHLGDPRG